MWNVSSFSIYNIQPGMNRSYPRCWFAWAIQQFNTQPNTLRLRGRHAWAKGGRHLSNSKRWQSLRQSYFGKGLPQISVKGLSKPPNNGNIQSNVAERKRHVSGSTNFASRVRECLQLLQHVIVVVVNNSHKPQKDCATQCQSN